MTMISIRQVSKKFGRTEAVSRVSLDIPAGDSVALWGTNGAGKTTLLRCVLGLLSYRGTITIGGHDVRRDGKRARMLVGYVPQELGFYDELRVAEAVVFFARLKAIRGPSIDAVLASVGLTGHEGKRIRELSGGMKQRLALAIAMLGDPPVLVLDEVTASLDACGRREFVGLLSRLSGSGRTVLFASHRLDEVGTLAKRVVVLERGSVRTIGAAADFVAGIGAGVVMHLVIPETLRGGAMNCLREEGFTPTLNGIGLLVPVEPDRKAEPLRILAEARVRVDDFELLNGADAGGIEPGPEVRS